MKSGSPVKFIALGACLCAIGAASILRTRSDSSFLGIDPKLIGPTDPDYAARFYIGHLIFRIPNRFLIFPWPDGRQPFDRTLCDQPDKLKEPVEVAVCNNPRQSVFLKIPVPRYSATDQNAFANSLATLGYGLGYIVPHYSVEQFEAGPSEADGFVFGTRRRVPELDMTEYAAFRAGEYIYVKKSEGDEFRLITCTSKKFVADTVEDLNCTARMSFLADRFPQTDSGRYQYTIEFGFPGTEIDRVADVGDSVSKAISAFLEADAIGK